MKALLAATLVKYHQLCFTWREPVRRNFQRASRSIASFADDDCWHRFRTRKTDLYRLLKAFKMDFNIIRGDNNSIFTGEEILLIGLHRYCVPGPLDQTMKSIFNLEFSQLSRAIKLFNTSLIENFSYLLTDRLDYWSTKFEIFANKIAAKLAAVGDIHYPVGTFRVFGFHDDTVIATCRPGSGPDMNNDS
jgi:hypothetical protein